MPSLEKLVVPHPNPHRTQKSGSLAVIIGVVVIVVVLVVICLTDYHQLLNHTFHMDYQTSIVGFCIRKHTLEDE